MPKTTMPKPKARIEVTLTYDQWQALLRGLLRVEQLKPAEGENVACFAMEISQVKRSRDALMDALAKKIASQMRR